MNHFLAKFKYWIESDWVSFTTKSKTKILFSQNALQICNAWCINISQTSPFCYFGTIFVWRLQYCAAPIHYADNFIWKLAFAFSKVGINLSDVKVLLMEKGWICKTLFHFADFTRWLREYSEQWKICWIQWKDFDWEKMEKNDSLSAHLIFRARGSDEHFLLTRTQLHTGEGRAPSLSLKCSGNIWSGFNIWCTYRVIIQDL